MTRGNSSWRVRPLFIVLVLLAFTAILAYVTRVRDRRSPLKRSSTHVQHSARPTVTVSQGSAGRRRNVSEVHVHESHGSLLEWKLYGVDEDHPKGVSDISNNRTGVNNSDSTAYGHSSRVLLETSFQERLHVGTPLSCHPGEEGLISVKYERFLRTLVNYTSFHKNSGESDSNARTLVWRCAWLEHCGGLVDRLRGITYALLLAIFSRRRLILNWGGIERTFLTPNLIDWTNGPVFNKTLDKGAEHSPEFYVFSGARIDSRTFDTIGGEKETVILVTNLAPSSLQSKVKLTAHQKWIQNGLRQTGLDSLSHEDLDNVVGVVFRYLFQTKPELLEEVARARNVLGLDDRPYTGVHIRSGFVGSSHSLETADSPKLVRGKSVWEAMLKCGLSTADTLLGNSSLLFLATDSELVKNLAVSKYGARFRTLNNSLVHIDRLSLVLARAPALNEKEGVLVGLVEFLLLAEAYSHVRGFSGYSWGAGLLCSLPGERVFDGLKCVPESQVRRY